MPRPPGGASSFARRTSLRAKINALTISLIALTSVGVTAFQMEGERAAGRGDLLEHGLALGAMVARNCEFGLYAEDVEALRQVVDAAFFEASVAYCAIRRPDRKVLHARCGRGVDMVPERAPPVAAGNPRKPRHAEVRDPTARLSIFEIWVPVVSQGRAELNDPLAPGSGGSGEIVGHVQLGLSLTPLHNRLRRQLRNTLAFTTGVILLGCGLSLLVALRITSPLRQLEAAAAHISAGEGDLTRSLGIGTSDEVGALAHSFNLFTAKLREMVLRTRDAAAGLEEAAGEIGESSKRTREGAWSQSQAAGESLVSVEVIVSATREVAQSTAALVTSAESSSGATQQLEASSQEIASRTGELFAAVDRTTATLREVSATAQQIAGAVEVLSASAASSAAAIQQLNASIKTIRAGAEQTGQLSQQAAKDAETGRMAVEQSIDGIQGIQETSERVGAVIQELGTRCQDIGAILGVIDEVADQTGLLALNAAILAAQAGEHGRGFSVVATEIRDLAERTAHSTGEITAIIESLQEKSREAVRAVRESRAGIHAEVARAESSRSALSTIQRSTETAAEQVRRIASATDEQSRSSDEITSAIQLMAHSVDDIASTIQQQAMAMNHLTREAELVRGLASEVNLSTAEQARGTQNISNDMARVREGVEAIDEATRKQTERALLVVESIVHTRDIAQETVSRAEALDRVLTRLTEQIGSLQGEIRAFTV